MREALGANSVEVGYWSTVFLLSVIFFIGVGGVLTAKIGEKKTMILSWLVIIPAPLIYIFAPTWHFALIGAFLEGASMLAAAPIGSYITSLSAGSRRGRAFAGSSAAIALGGVPGPALGGVMITLFGYTLVFLTSFLLFIISTILVLPISPIPTTKEERAQHRSLEFFKNRVFIVLTLFWFTVGTMFWIANMFVPLFLFDRWALTEAQIGVFGSIRNASGAILSPLLGWVGDRWSYIGALVFPVLGTFGFYGLLVVSPSVAFFPLIYALSGLIHCFSLNTAVLSHNIPRGQLADALASYNIIARLLSPVSPIIGGVAYSFSPSLPLVITSVLTPIPLTLLYFLKRAEGQAKRLQESTEEDLRPVSVEELRP
jgi:MFS family permease